MTTAAVSTATTSEIEIATSPVTNGPSPRGASDSALAASLALPRGAASAGKSGPGSAKPAQSGPNGSKTARIHAKSDLNGPDKQGAGTVFAGVLAALTGTPGTATPASRRNAVGTAAEKGPSASAGTATADAQAASDRGTKVTTFPGTARPGEPSGSTPTSVLAAQPSASAGLAGANAAAQAGAPRNGTGGVKPQAGDNQGQGTSSTLANLEVRVQRTPAVQVTPTTSEISASTHLRLGPGKGNVAPAPDSVSLRAGAATRGATLAATHQGIGQGATEGERLAATTGPSASSASAEMTATGRGALTRTASDQTGTGPLGATKSSPAGETTQAAQATKAAQTAGATNAGATSGNAIQQPPTPGTSHGAGAIQDVSSHYGTAADQKGSSSTNDHGAGTTNGEPSQYGTASGSAPGLATSAAQAAAGATTAFVAPPANGPNVHALALTHPAANTAQQPKPEPLPTQLATVLVPAAHRPDGSYQVSIRLQPEELGTVHIALHLENGTLNVSLHAEGDATRNLLRQNLNQLRAQLASTGLSTGSFDVGDRPSPNRGWEGRGVAAPNKRIAGISAQPNYSTPAGQSPASPIPIAAAGGPLDMRL